MKAELPPNSALDAAGVVVDRAPVAPHQVLQGSPVVGMIELLSDHLSSVGIWEITPGIVTDTEVDEIFVVVSGRATVEFEGDDRTVTLGPGSVGRLAAGSRTRWTVTETFRKIYVTTQDAEEKAR